MKKRKLAVVMAVLVVMNIGTVFASNDNHSYSYVIKAGFGNTYSNSRYRQTKDTNNKWKVNMTYSGEGKGTVTRYWLALFNSNHTRVSDTHDVKVGTGDHYYKANSGANQKEVCLGAENNNNSTNTYTVSGYWDEEIN